MALYFENQKTKKRFKVLSWDPDTNEVRLQGEHGEFTETFSKKKFKEMDYKPVEVADEPASDDEDEDED